MGRRGQQPPPAARRAHAHAAGLALRVRLPDRRRDRRAGRQGAQRRRRSAAEGLRPVHAVDPGLRRRLPGGVRQLADGRRQLDRPPDRGVDRSARRAPVRAGRGVRGRRSAHAGQGRQGPLPHIPALGAGDDQVSRPLAQGERRRRGGRDCRRGRAGDRGRSSASKEKEKEKRLGPPFSLLFLLAPAYFGRYASTRRNATPYSSRASTAGISRFAQSLSVVAMLANGLSSTSSTSSMCSRNEL